MRSYPSALHYIESLVDVSGRTAAMFVVAGGIGSISLPYLLTTIISGYHRPAACLPNDIVRIAAHGRSGFWACA